MNCNRPGLRHGATKILEVNNVDTFEYMGEKITVDNRGYFQSELVGSEPALAAIEVAIKIAKGDAARYDLNLVVMTIDGAELTLRRIHQGTGRWMDSKGEEVVHAVYHNTVEARDALQALTLANTAREEAANLFHRFRIGLPTQQFSGRDKGAIGEIQLQVKATIEAGPPSLVDVTS